jgi:uncharacterized membrane protein YdbT with pleckstrin-like domain
MFVIVGLINGSQLLVNSIKYSMGDKTIHIEQSIIYLRKTTIPLDQITDITIVQKFQMKYVGMWALQIQTVGSRYYYPEVTLLGLFNPEQVRDEIMTAKETFIKSLKSM